MSGFKAGNYSRRTDRTLKCTLIGLNALSLPPSFVGSANRAFIPIWAQYRSVKKYKISSP